MELHSLSQGSKEWHTHRLTHFNASDAPAMMGCSSYKTRSQLLHEMHTGMVPEVDAATQRRFDDGHRFEALARPLAEEIIGDDLYPVVGSLSIPGLNRKVSASFDGLTLDRKIDSEHKSLNSELREAIKDDACGYLLPLQYRVQMEQQLLVSGAEKCLFMASKWNRDELIEERHTWYFADFELRQRIIDGWAQFEKDLDTYVPTVTEVKAVAKVTSSLPVVLDMRVEGKLVACNIEQYKPAALAYISNINTELTTDQHFADADADAKFCRDSADKLELSIEQAMGQMGDINVAINTVREIAAAFDAKGLALEKLVKSEKDARKLAIVSEAAAELVTHIKALNQRLGAAIMPTIASEFQGVVRGLKSIDSMRDKVATELARCKIEANATADRIGVNLKAIELASNYQFLFADASTLALKDHEFVAMTIKNRVADHQTKEATRLEAERTRIAEEENKKAQARADAEIAEAARQAEATRQAEQEAAQLAADAQAVIDKAKLPELVSVRLAESSLFSATTAPVLSEKVIADRNANAFIDQIEAKQTPPTLKLGVIQSRLSPVSIDAAGLVKLGFHPTQVGASKLYQESDFDRICTALILHITEVRQGVAA